MQNEILSAPLLIRRLRHLRVWRSVGARLRITGQTVHSLLPLSPSSIAYSNLVLANGRWGSAANKVTRHYRISDFDPVHNSKMRHINYNVITHCSPPQPNSVTIMAIYLYMSLYMKTWRKTGSWQHIALLPKDDCATVLALSGLRCADVPLRNYSLAAPSQVTCVENFVKFGMWSLRYRPERQAVIALRRTRPEGEVIIGVASHLPFVTHSVI